MSYLPAGSVIDYRRDSLPSNGNHLDIRIRPLYGDNNNTLIDPSLRPHLLRRVFIGDGDNRQTLTSFPLTSGYGPRNTGIPGASKFHEGHDYGIDADMPIFVQGGSRYWSENGVGIVALNDDDGNPYEFEFRHVNVADDSDVTPDSAPLRAEARERVKAYKEMTKSELDSAYDAMRSDVSKAEDEGMKMHKAFFGKK